VGPGLFPCFHSQQAAEKALKALLVADGQPVPRTHDLVQVLDSLAAQHPQLQNLAEPAALLSQFGVTPRYPSFLSAETEADARSALAAAEQLVETVLHLLP
jgi:HEPN domain-containing protein